MARRSILTRFGLDPIRSDMKITNPDGTPTKAFLRNMLSQRSGNVTTADDIDSAIALVNALAAKQITTTSPITGGGPLGGTITPIGLADTAVTPGTYGDDLNVPQITVDQKGRITSVVDVPITGGGGGGGSSMYGAQATRSTNQAYAAATDTLVQFVTEVYDDKAFINLGTNNTRITIPAGIDRIILTAELTVSNATGDKYCQIKKNGAFFVGGGNARWNSSMDRVFVTSAVLSVVPGDYFELNLFAAVGAGNITTASFSCAAWNSAGGTDPVSPFWATTPVPPLIASWTLGQAAANSSMANVSRGIRLTTTGGGAANRNAFLYRTTPGATWTATALGVPNWSNRSFMGWGMAVRDNTTGRLECFQIGVTGTAGQVVLRHQRWTTYDVFSADVGLGTLTSSEFFKGPVWIRLARVGANYVVSMSQDGEFYTTFYTVATGGFVASIDQVGPWFGTFQNTLPSGNQESLLLMSADVV